MQISDEININLKLDHEKANSKVIKSPEASGNIYIQKLIYYHCKEYRIVSINNFAFFNNKAIKSVKFPDDSELRSIFNNSFRKSSIEYIFIPPKVKKIDYLAFFGCNNLKSIEFSAKSKLLIIGHSAFMYCPLKKIIIPSSVTHISNSAFNHCKELQFIEFQPNSKLHIINEMAFMDCTSLVTITIPSSVKKIVSRAFMNCFNLRKVVLTENSKLNSIGTHSFFFTSLEKFFIPSKVSNLEDGWCYGLKNLNDLSISPHNSNFSIYNDQFVLGKTHKERSPFDIILFARSDAEKIVIPSFIKRIGPYSFSYHQNLKTIKFLNDSKIERIEKFAFSYSFVEKVTLPITLNIIQTEAFSACLKLKSIEFSENSIGTEKVKCITKIGKFAFLRCPALEKIEFLGNELLLENQCFQSCSNLWLISCPNAEFVYLSLDSFGSVSRQFSLFIKANSQIFEKV